MCGIAGFFAPGAELGPWFARSVLKAAHRGPDGNGWWIPGMTQGQPLDTLQEAARTPVCLGHLRLSILDLSPAGAQPMVEPGRAAVVLNGEIYNYLELREELIREGWAFRSGSDTEVVLKGWLHWGMDLLPRMNGMWAIALWDEASQSLLLTRDRFGEKPLFLADWKGGLAFASEVKQFREFPELTLDLDPARAAAFLVTGRPYEGPTSWFKGIRQLAPGGWLRIDAQGHREGSYYDLEAAVRAVEPAPDAEAWAARFSELLAESVRLRLRSDVPVGSCLSEGLDSSAILAKAVKQPLQGEYHSFTLGSDDPLIDERPHAAAFAGAMGSRWHGITAVGDDFGSLWDRMTWHQETAVASTSLYGQWKVLEAARAARVIVMLDGQGADEILAGYHKFFVAHARRTVRRNPFKAVGILGQFLRHVGGAPGLLKYGYRYFRGVSGAPSPRAWLKPGLFEGASAPSLALDGLGMRLADVRRWSFPNLLSYEDRNAMAHSVETRLPYLDPALVAWALATPEEVLFTGGWSKWPLRKSLAGDGAPQVAWRRGKRQFFVPQSDWMRTQLAPQVEAWMKAPHPLWDEILAPGRLREFQEKWRRQKPGHAWDDLCFQMVSLDRFLRVWWP